MSRDLLLYYDDILDAIANIREFTFGMGFDAFRSDLKTQHACIRNLEVIGEATKHIPGSARATAPEIEWRKISGLRDILTHEYSGVDVEIFWDVIGNKLADLESAVQKLRAQTIE